LYDTIGEIIIRINASKKENDLILRVENPFDPETSSPKQGTGFGLSSVQRRLYLLFARNDLLTTEAKENIFITIVKIPQLELSLIDKPFKKAGLHTEPASGINKLEST
jgi:LytS/YehU family sensor histidine kinase